MQEIWKPIADYEETYFISNLGRIRRKDGYKMKNHLGKIGYYTINLSRNGKIKQFYVHRLVASAFIPNPCGYKYINHKDEDKTNNNVGNLEWCTQKHNLNWGTSRARLSKSRMENPHNNRCVSQYTLDGKFVNAFYSTAEAERVTGIAYTSIVACCRGYRKYSHAGGYKWKYISKDDYRYYQKQR